MGIDVADLNRRILGVDLLDTRGLCNGRAIDRRRHCKGLSGHRVPIPGLNRHNDHITSLQARPLLEWNLDAGTRLVGDAALIAGLCTRGGTRRKDAHHNGITVLDVLRTCNFNGRVPLSRVFRKDQLIQGPLINGQAFRRNARLLILLCKAGTDCRPIINLSQVERDRLFRGIDHTRDWLAFDHDRLSGSIGQEGGLAIRDILGDLEDSLEALLLSPGLLWIKQFGRILAVQHLGLQLGQGTVQLVNEFDAQRVALDDRHPQLILSLRGLEHVFCEFNLCFLGLGLAICADHRDQILVAELQLRTLVLRLGQGHGEEGIVIVDRLNLAAAELAALLGKVGDLSLVACALQGNPEFIVHLEVGFRKRI